ncbi:MAG: PEP-CTERM sorting domain-containing protein [Acidobacteria bacterium]|nr:PEP-CTERM sorting domain-containing protein [Acidobacteriota bacterium]
MKITNILAGAMLLSSSMFAVTITTFDSTPFSGSGSASFKFGNDASSGEVFDIPTKLGSVKGDSSLRANGYEWALSWNVDPTLSWSYTTVINGLQTIDFEIDIVPDAYNQIFNSAGYSLTGTKNSKGAGIKNFTVQAYVPYPGTYIPVGDVSVPGVSGVKGTKTDSNDNSNLGGVGPFVAFGPAVTPLKMGVKISFESTLTAGDQLSLNGTLTIEKDAPPVPEPATFGLIGAALVALGAVARRRA